MNSTDPQHTDIASASDSHDVIDGVDDSLRRAALLRLGKMAALTSPALLTILLSTRASADSPPADPT